MTTTSETTDPGKLKVLVVDDDATIRAMVALMLRHCKLKVYDARNGREGLSVAEVVRPQLILLDITMPGMDGTEMTKKLRAHEDTVLQMVPIILLTASSEEMRQAALDAGANTVLEKPFTKSILIQFIEMYLGPVCSGGKA